MERDFKGVWIPKEIWINNELGWTEKLLLVEIHSLEKNRECYATNKYFADFFNLSKSRISKMISKLCEKKYIQIELIYKENSKEIEKRIIKTAIGYNTKVTEGISQNSDTPIGEKCQDINIYNINNTKNNNTMNNINTLSGKEKPDSIPFSEIIDYLNQKTESKFLQSSKATQTLIKARWKDGFRLEDFKKVIDQKVADWITDKKMHEYLRPQTLFGTKFESYLNATTRASPKKKDYSSFDQSWADSLLNEEDLI